MDEEDVDRRRHERLHIITGMLTAVENRTRFLEVVGGAADGDAARDAVMREFGLDESQATAALDLPVRRFARRELQRLRGECDELARMLGPA